MPPKGGLASAASETIFTVTTHDGALQLLAKVGAFSQRAEPSSPVSYLTERARTLTGRDFLGLLKDMLPPDALKTLEGMSLRMNSFILRAWQM